MAKIVLSNGQEVKVSPQDYDRLSRHSWHLVNGYPSRMAKQGGKNVRIRMHREVMGNPDGDVDHKDRNRLNAERSNLRVVSREENGINRSGWGQTGIKNVRKKGDRFVAEIRRGGKLQHLGYFETARLAGLAVANAT